MSKLKMVNTSLGDWYLIERAEHDGRQWMEKTKYGHSLVKSARISDADIEGSAAEMLEIAKAIRARGEFLAKRCAVVVEGELVKLCSPRNSTRDGECSLKEADALAKQILATLRKPKKEEQS